LLARNHLVAQTTKLWIAEIDLQPDVLCPILIPPQLFKPETKLLKGLRIIGCQIDFDIGRRGSASN